MGDSAPLYPGSFFIDSELFRYSDRDDPGSLEMRWRLDRNWDLPSSFDFFRIGCVYDRDRFVVPFSLALALTSLKCGSASIVIGAIHPRSTSLV